METRIKIKSLWCIFNKLKNTTEHEKCGGKTYRFRGLGSRDESIVYKLDDAGFLEGVCKCKCHKSRKLK